MRLLVLLGATLALAQNVATEKQQAYISLNSVPMRFEVVTGPPTSDAVAWGTFEDEIKNNGFGYLEITTNPIQMDNFQTYAAGILEGYFTRKLISMHYNNTMRDYCNNEKPYCDKLNKFLQDNLNYMNKQIAANRDTDPYWHHVELSLNQLQGIQDAWTGNKKESYFPANGYTKVTPLLFLNIDGDLEDIEPALRRNNVRRVVGGGSCSALIKLLPDNKDLYFSHVTWSAYSTMLRILKKYNFSLREGFNSETLVPGNKMSFSSSPGRIFSGDDFHIMGSGLVSMETTIGNSEPSLYKNLTPKSVLEWLRTINANRLSKDGAQWASNFKREKSGTYNNQWMVVDYNKFTAGKPLVPGTLTVLEEIPGTITSGDQTQVLTNQTYWPSYNIPYYKDIYNTSGWPAQVAKYGDWFTYDNSPRAKIFRRDHSKITDMDSMTKMMRYNDYTHDEFSKCECTPPYSAENAISARCDLNPIDGKYPFAALGHRSHGATDMKITNSDLAKKFQFLAVAGPTYNPLPPFQWSKSGLNDLHEGHPDLWKFEPHIHEW